MCKYLNVGLSLGDPGASPYRHGGIISHVWQVIVFYSLKACCFCLSEYFINAGGGEGGHRVLVCCWVLGSVPGSGSCLVILKICDRTP